MNRRRVARTEDELKCLSGPSGNTGNVLRVEYACHISLWLIWLTCNSQRIRPVKGRIRDHKEFWGLSPNVPYENCDVNPISGPFDFRSPGTAVAKGSSK